MVKCPLVGFTIPNNGQRIPVGFNKINVLPLRQLCWMASYKPAPVPVTLGSGTVLSRQLAR